MAYQFEKWMGTKKMYHGSGHMPYVNFSENGNDMYVSAKLLRMERSSHGKFDLLVDREARVFALRFIEAGKFKLSSIPSSVNVRAFVAEFKPKQGKRILMKKDDTTGLWIGNLDNDKVDMSK